MTDRSPFEAAAPFYDRFRAPYPPEAVDYIVSAFGLDDRARVLDLGCGPGSLSIPLSLSAAEVVAIDPDESMLAEGKTLAAARGRGNIRWVHAAAEEVSPDLGLFRAVTMGQSFHWMKRDLVLERISAMVDQRGGLALVNPGKRRPQESWEVVASQVVTKYLGRRERHASASPEPEHEPSLRRSGYFSHFTTREFSSEITRDIPSVLGCLYSSTGAAKPLLGDRSPQFEAELSEALLRVNPTGVFRERLETEVLIAPKSAGSWT